MAIVSFILNGRLKKINVIKQHLSELLKPLNHQVYFFETTAKENAINLVKNAFDNKSNFLIAVGGDGTLNEVINGYMKYYNPSQNKLILGLLPRGTGNDFAKTLGIDKNINHLISRIEKNKSIKIDVGEIQYTSLNKLKEKRFFINITDIGIGGIVSKQLSESNRILGPDLTYIKAIIQSFISYKPITVNLKSDTFQWKGKAMSICIANGKYFGSGMCIAPQANITDGEMQLVILGNVSMFDYLRNLSGIKKGEIFIHPEVHYASVTSCQIDAEKNSCPIDMDGEFIGYAPLSLKTYKKALPFLSN